MLPSEPAQVLMGAAQFARRYNLPFRSGGSLTGSKLPDAQAAFARPEWLGDEVTDDRRYYNNALASAPFDSWEAA